MTPVRVARQAALFGTVGAVATAVHVLVALIVRTWAGWEPLQANFAAYLCAVAVSYLGNTRLTFGGPVLQGTRFTRFVAVSLAGLGCNQALVYLLVDRMGLPFWIGLAAVVVVVPALSFAAIRSWAFATATEPLAPRLGDDGERPDG